MKKSIVLISNLVIIFILSTSQLTAKLFDIKDQKSTFLGSDFYPNDATKAAALDAAGFSDNITSSLTELSASVNKDFTEIGLENFMTGMGDAGSAANKSYGVDYGSNPEVFVLGIGVGPGVSGDFVSLFGADSSASNSLPAVGVAANFSLIGGINSSVFFPRKIGPLKSRFLNIYGNFLTVPLDSVVGEVGSEATSFGLHASYHMIGASSLLGGLLGWGGVQLTSGFDVTTMKIIYSQSLSQGDEVSIDLGGTLGSETFKTDFEGEAEFEINVDTFTVPIEISTNLQMFYVLTIIAGVGIDFNIATATSKSSVSGPITIEGGEDQTVTAGTGVLNLESEESPDFASFRIFFGPQFNVFLLRIPIMIHVIPQSNSYSLKIGASIVY